jgi:hypothetical protein
MQTITQPRPAPAVAAGTLSLAEIRRIVRDTLG